MTEEELTELRDNITLAKSEYDFTCRAGREHCSVRTRLLYELIQASEAFLAIASQLKEYKP